LSQVRVLPAEPIQKPGLARKSLALVFSDILICLSINPDSVFPLSGISILVSAIEIRQQRLKNFQMFSNNKSLGIDRLRAIA
jgi:hypothetical protein